jgi:hypothetical protein
MTDDFADGDLVEISWRSSLNAELRTFTGTVVGRPSATYVHVLVDGLRYIVPKVDVARA